MKPLKQKKCKRCGTLFAPFTSLQKACSVACSIILSKEYNQKLANQKWNQEKKVMKEKLKTLSEYEKDARKVFQKFIRMRDAKLGCISCGNFNATQYDAGHYLNANQFSGLIFDENNCFKQCVFCNHHLSGNYFAYRIGLQRRFGNEFVDTLEAKANANRVYKYTRDELIEIKNKYTLKIKELENRSRNQEPNS